VTPYQSRRRGSGPLLELRPYGCVLFFSSKMGKCVQIIHFLNICGISPENSQANPLTKLIDKKCVPLVSLVSTVSFWPATLVLRPRGVDWRATDPTSLAGAVFSLAGTAALAGYTPRWAGSCRDRVKKRADAAMITQPSQPRQRTRGTQTPRLEP
jgi:hypothetical protein